MYTNQTVPVYMGVEAAFNGYIEAPHAHVNVAPFSDFNGCIHANSLRVEADATVTGDNLRPVIIASTIQCTTER